MKALVVVVSYNTPIEAEKALESCFKCFHGIVHGVVIENGEKAVLPVHSKINFVHYPDNPGYFGAMERYLKMETFTEDYDFYILANSDIQFTSQFDLGRHRDFSNVGVIAPSITSELSGAQQNPLYRNAPSRFKLQVLSMVYSFGLLARIYDYSANLKNKWHRRSPKYASNEKIFAPNGACLIVSKNTIRRGFTFSPVSQLYGEELVLGSFCRENNLQIVTDFSIEVLHHESTSTSKVDRNKIYALKRRSIQQLLKDYFPG